MGGFSWGLAGLGVGDLGWGAVGWRLNQVYSPSLSASWCVFSLYWDRLLYPVEDLRGVYALNATVDGGRSGNDQG